MAVLVMLVDQDLVLDQVADLGRDQVDLVETMEHQVQLVLVVEIIRVVMEVQIMQDQLVLGAMQEQLVLEVPVPQVMAAVALLDKELVLEAARDQVVLDPVAHLVLTE
jgi:hypothetical protein